MSVLIELIQECCEVSLGVIVSSVVAWKTLLGTWAYLQPLGWAEMSPGVASRCGMPCSRLTEGLGVGRFLGTPLGASWFRRYVQGGCPISIPCEVGKKPRL